MEFCFVYFFQVMNLQERGTHFLKIPKTYYDNLRERLAKSEVKITESLDVVCLGYEPYYI